jgi:hypothetical protein
MRKFSFIIFFTFLSQICFSQYNLDSTSANTIQLSGYVLRKKASKVKLVDTDTLIVWTSYGLVIKSLKHHIKKWEVDEDKALLKHLQSSSKSLAKKMDEINANPVLKSRLEFRTIDILRSGKCEVYNKVLKQNETQVACIDYWKKWWTGVKFLTSKNTLVIDVRTGSF